MKYLLPLLLISCTPQVKDEISSLKFNNKILKEEVVKKEKENRSLRLDNARIMIQHLETLKELRKLKEYDRNRRKI
jgi:hypothetical protein